jgi:hypothetical protein
MFRYECTILWGKKMPVLKNHLIIIRASPGMSEIFYILQKIPNSMSCSDQTLLGPYSVSVTVHAMNSYGGFDVCSFCVVYFLPLPARLDCIVLRSSGTWRRRCLPTLRRIAQLSSSVFDPSTLEDEDCDFLETSGNSKSVTRLHVPEDLNS